MRVIEPLGPYPACPGRVRLRNHAVVPGAIPRDFGVCSTGVTISAAVSGKAHLSAW